MKRGKVKNKFLILTLLVLGVVITLCSFVSAEINVKNVSVDVNYLGGENIRGLMNISLTNEPYDALVSGFNKNVLLLNFLNKNNLTDKAGISCSIYNCSEGYDSIEALSDTFSLGEGASTVIGFKIIDSEEIQEISEVLFDISTDAGTSCSENMQMPLKIDVLDDDFFEWTSKDSSYNYNPLGCGEKNYGCYDSSDKDVEMYPITLAPYCEKINLGPGGGIKVGADISCSENAEFIIKVSSSGVTYPLKSASFMGGDNVAVNFNYSSESSRNITVCIQAKNSSYSNKCNITVQDNGNQSCGYSGGYSHDFSIFAQSLAYSVPENISISHTQSNQKILNYLSSHYSKNCSKGCIIPIRIISNQKQELKIRDGQIIHKSSGLQQPPSGLYELIKKFPSISMNFTVLDISKSGINVPSLNGNYTLKLSIGNKSIIQKQIFVSNIPNVGFVFPYEVIVGENTRFSAYSSLGNISSYKWNFGDGSAEQTTTANNTIHNYISKGQYTMKVTATSSKGQASSFFNINVVDLSKESIIRMLEKNNENLANIETEVSQIPTWLKDYVDNQLKINDTQAEINMYLSSINSSNNLTEVISYLGSLKIASSFDVSESSSGILIVDQNKINPTSLINAGAGNMNSYIDETFYRKAVYGWLISNMDINVEEKVYSLFYNDRNDPMGSYFKITLTPINGYSGKLFLAINKNSNDLIFKDKLKTKNESQTTIILFDGSSSSKEIEFFVKGRVDPTDLPIYLSPEFSNLNLFSNPKCFIDGRCDSSIGEDADTCPSDCKSTLLQIIISIIVLLILAFIVYIILQEWYKKKYEDFLFKSKDDLYNVINFISNAEKQAMSKSEIFGKLLNMRWSNEQLVFAYKKLHGQRTGMYEIPIMKIFEKRKVQLEVDKRRAVGNTGNIAPRPMIMPPQGKFMGSPKVGSPQNINKKI